VSKYGFPAKRALYEGVVLPNEAGATGAGRIKENGRGERIRTSGLYVPNVALYQAKLHPV
jgi:hypothetical protein